MENREQFDPSGATDPQLFVLARLAHLREYGFGDPDLPAWVLHLPLADEPYEMSSDRIDRCIAGLVERGMVTRNEAPADDGGAPEVRYAASDACMELVEPLRRELRARHPTIPQELAALILLVDAIGAPEGFERDILHQCLEEPPGSLPTDDAVSLYRKLMREAWIFATKRPENPLQWFPAPKSWAWKDGVEAALLGRQPEMRSRLAAGVIARLEVAAGSLLHGAIESIDRAHFVPDHLALLAYRKRPVSIASREDGTGGTTTSSPDVCATIAQALDLKPGDQVLVCGVKGGYTAALCAHIVGPSGRVECLESDLLVAEHARRSLARAGLDDRRVRIHLVRDVTIGRDSHQQWDAAVVNGKIPKVPRAILKQMADGGRLLIFLQDGEDRGQTAYLIRMDGQAIRNQALSSFSFTPIYGEFGYDPPNWQENLELVGASPHDAFVSFSTRDLDACQAIVAELEESGIRCWLSARDHPIGRDGYAEAIMSAISQSQLFVVVLSHDSLESDHVKNELAQATNQRKTILPVRLAECPRRLPASFQYHVERYQHVDLGRDPPKHVVQHALTLLQRDAVRATRTADPADTERRAEADKATDRFLALFESAVADGRLTRAEVDDLVALAIAAGVAADQREARAIVVQRARSMRPDIEIEPER